VQTVDHLGEGDLTGCWLVQTASGSVHLLDFGSVQVTRVRAAEEPVADFGVSDLRRDGEAVPLLAIGPVAVGLPLAMVLQVRSDPVETTRLTTPVVSIRRLPPGDSPPGATGRNGPTSSSTACEPDTSPSSEGE
jgi:hypothetical protein